MLKDIKNKFLNNIKYYNIEKIKKQHKLTSKKHNDFNKNDKDETFENRVQNNNLNNKVSSLYKMLYKDGNRDKSIYDAQQLIQYFNNESIEVLISKCKKVIGSPLYDIYVYNIDNGLIHEDPYYTYNELNWMIDELEKNNYSTKKFTLGKNTNDSIALVFKIKK